MRISDWSSDVCSSDLEILRHYSDDLVLDFHPIFGCNIGSEELVHNGPELLKALERPSHELHENRNREGRPDFLSELAFTPADDPVDQTIGPFANTWLHRPDLRRSEVAHKDHAKWQVLRRIQVEGDHHVVTVRSEEQASELQSLMGT